MTFVSLVCLVWMQPAVELQLRDDGLLAVVTHKGGALSGLAHNHFIAAERFSSDLRWDGEDVTSLRGTISLRVGNLSVDDPIKATHWFPMIQSLGWLEEQYGLVTKKDRDKIRKSMLGKKQLHQKQYPEIRATIDDIREEPGNVGAESFTHVMTVSFTIKDQTVVLSVPSRLVIDPNGLKIEAAVSTTFSAFGIEPYSAMLGAVSNKDRFDLLVSLMAY